MTWERFKLTLAGIAAIIGAAWATMPETVQALLVLMLVDFLTGYLAAWTTGKVSSDTGAKGIMKKLAIMAGLTTAYVMQEYLHLPIAEAAALAWCVTEGTSILENLVRMGVPVPDVIKTALSDATKRKLARGERKYDAA